MAKEIISDSLDAPTPERDSAIAAAAPRGFQPVVFGPGAPTSDFGCSEAIALTAAPTEAAAWAAVFAALRRDATLIGGEVRAWGN